MIKFVSEKEKSEKLPEEFEPYIKKWFYSNFKSLSEPQKYSFNLIHKKKNTLICAPTGSGKTLSAFLTILNELFLLADKKKLENRIYVIYISPLRALNNDIEKNLRKPLIQIRQIAKKMKIDLPEVRAEIRTSDTSQQQRAKQLKNPPHILITTPESLGIILAAPKFRNNFKEAKYIIVDEIHSLCENKRGTHLSLSLERLNYFVKQNCGLEPVRIGLSATQAPIQEIAKYLVGFKNGKTRDCEIVDVSAAKKMDLKVISPVSDLLYSSGAEIHKELYEKLHKLIQAHRTTLIFTNTRAATERVVYNLKTMFPKYYKDNIGAHHSSIGRKLRLEIEEKLKKGKLKVVVTSTSLELGIDIGYIDLVVQIGSPKGISRAIQRIGRSGHKLQDISKGRIIVLDRNSALECVTLSKCVKENKLDNVRIPKNCLDVLIQHVVGMAIEKQWDVDEAYNVIKQSYSYNSLKKEDFLKVLEYASGSYVSLEDQRVYAKIWLDLENNKFGKRGKMTRVIYMTNIGTIPEESSYKVYIRNTAKKIGSLDEGFLDRLTKGDIFVLGGQTYRFEYVRGMKVYVSQQKGAQPTVPSWFSEMLPLSYDLGLEIGRFNEKIETQLKYGYRKNEIVDWILSNYFTDSFTANSLYSYLSEQYNYIGTIPTHRKILVETTLDEKYRQNIIFHTIFGRRVNDALSRIFAYTLSDMINRNIGIIVDDHGFVLITSFRKISPEILIKKVLEQDLRKTLKKAIRKAEIMQRRFRHVASRSLMILRSYKGHRKSVGRQHLSAHFLLAACEKIDPDFPVIKETYREIMEDVMDINHTKEILEKIKNNEIEIVFERTDVPSPFSHNLVIQAHSDVVLIEDKKKRLQYLHKLVLERIKYNST